TYNLYQCIGELLEEKSMPFQLDVVRNDACTLSEIKKRKYDHIIISPGPGDASDKAYFGVCSDVITMLGKTTPILGVCLGMQGIAYAFGGNVVRAEKPMHGKTSLLSHNTKGLFANLPQNLEAMRYHSLVVATPLPNNLEITAESENKEPMGLQHKLYPIFGVQFHPESFATEGGKAILTNFLLNI
ncbi:MAG: anthranilate synthase component II, partial [Candidatus Levyibacteriota bacterium]